MNRTFSSLPGASLLFLCILKPGTSFAAVIEAPSLFSSSLKMIWGLLVVLGIILIIYGIARKRLTLLQGGGKGIITIIETKHLLPKKTLFLVEVRGREYLLGTGGESINLIAAIEDQPGNPATFKEVLHHSEAVTST